MGVNVNEAGCNDLASRVDHLIGITIDPANGNDPAILYRNIALNRQFEADPDLIEVMPPRPEWEAPLWLVTHVDLHRTRKVQAFLAFLKDASKDWPV